MGNRPTGARRMAAIARWKDLARSGSYRGTTYIFDAFGSIRPRARPDRNKPSIGHARPHSPTQSGAVTGTHQRAGWDIRPEFDQMGKGELPRSIHKNRLHAWENALALPSGWFLTPTGDEPVIPAPRRQPVTIVANSVANAIRMVAICLATRGRNLAFPARPVEVGAQRDADLFARRYGTNTRRRATCCTSTSRSSAVSCVLAIASPAIGAIPWTALAGSTCSSPWTIMPGLPTRRCIQTRRKAVPCSSCAMPWLDTPDSTCVCVAC